MGGKVYTRLTVYYYMITSLIKKIIVLDNIIVIKYILDRLFNTLPYSQ